jgi:hypothetical protein
MVIWRNASGIEWSHPRHQMNGPHGHLDRLLELCYARGLPFLQLFASIRIGSSKGNSVTKHLLALWRRPGTSYRFFEFFTAQIRNPNTRRAYARAVQEFLAWCEQHGVTSIAELQPLYIGT